MARFSRTSGAQYPAPWNSIPTLKKLSTCCFSTKYLSSHVFADDVQVARNCYGWCHRRRWSVQQRNSLTSALHAWPADNAWMPTRQTWLGLTLITHLIKSPTKNFMSIAVDARPSNQDLCILLDSELTLKQNVSNISSSCFHHLRRPIYNNGSIRVQLSPPSLFSPSNYHVSITATHCHPTVRSLYSPFAPVCPKLGSEICIYLILDRVTLFIEHGSDFIGCQLVSEYSLQT